MTEREVELLVLYGSQTGNAEQAAKDFSALAPSKLSSKDDDLRVKSRYLQLDDFLELEHAKFAGHVVVIFTSSYGVGQAPIGCYRFRELCNAILLLKEDDRSSSSLLKGIKYAMCGLGDSKYSTYFQNPTIIDEAFTSAGATRIGPLGKADASGTGEKSQSLLIEKWMDDIWSPLQATLLSLDDAPNLEIVTTKVNQFCETVFDDWRNLNSKKQQQRQPCFRLEDLFMVAGSVIMAVLVMAIMSGKISIL